MKKILITVACMLMFTGCGVSYENFKYKYVDKTQKVRAVDKALHTYDENRK